MSKAMGRLGRVVGVLTQQWVGSLAGETYCVQEEGIWRETHCLRGQRHGRRGEASARGRCKRQKAKGKKGRDATGPATQSWKRREGAGGASVVVRVTIIMTVIQKRMKVQSRGNKGRGYYRGQIEESNKTNHRTDDAILREPIEAKGQRSTISTRLTQL